MLHTSRNLIRTSRKWVLRVLLPTVLIFGAAVGIKIYLEILEQERLRLGGPDLDARVEEFEREPTPYRCLVLIGRFGNLKDHAKAIQYAERCINDLNSDSSKAGWFIRLYMASHQAALGRKQEAIIHLRKALELDTENRIKQQEYLIKDLGLSEIQSQINK